MIADDSSDYIGPRENVLYLLAELERAFERGDVVWASQDVARFQERLARLMARIAEARCDTDPATAGDQPGDLSSVTDGSSPMIER